MPALTSPARRQLIQSALALGIAGALPKAAPLQRAADASERTQRLLTAAEEKQKMLEQLLEELK